MSSHSTNRYQPITTKMDNPALSESSGDAEVDINTVETGLPATCSSQQLMPSSDTDSYTTQRTTGISDVTRTQWFTVAVLCFVNLINYMDRFTIAGVLTDIQEDFNIGDDEGGLLQTAFVLSYMICAPLFGYLGDRYSRRWIMAVGVALWSTTTILGSFMGQFGWFITFRALVGIGEASYSTIAPTIISDLFVHDMRSKMLALFYFAIPVGSGFGYIVGSETARFANNWRWALRVTPFLGIAAVILIILTKEPERGESEGSHNLAPTSYTEDLKALVKIRSFMLSTAGFTCVAFVTGALAWWGPKFIYLGIKMQPGSEDLTLNDVSFRFGFITMMAGLVGVPCGPLFSYALRKRLPSADAIVCAFGLLSSAFMLAGAMILVSKYTIAAYVLTFFGQFCLNLNWAIVADMLLYVVVPTRRSTAEAFQILISHALGDAGSPYFVGVLSEAFKTHLRTTTVQTSEYLKVLSLTLAENVTANAINLLDNISANATNLRDAVSANASSLVDAISANASSILLNDTMTLNSINPFNSTNTFSGADNYNGTFMFNATASALYAPSVFDSPDTNVNKFKALQYALFSTSFIEVLGGIFFLLTAGYIIVDKRRASQSINNVDELTIISDEVVKKKNCDFEDSDCVECMVLCSDITLSQRA